MVWRSGQRECAVRTSPVLFGWARPCPAPDKAQVGPGQGQALPSPYLVGIPLPPGGQTLDLV